MYIVIGIYIVIGMYACRHARPSYLVTSVFAKPVSQKHVSISKALLPEDKIKNIIKLIKFL